MSADASTVGNVQKKHKGNTCKREGYIGWDEYFMGIALLGAQRSKDPVTQVGACIVNMDNKIVGSGYNGMPIGCSDDEFSWEKPDKHYYVCHAEMNAIINKFSTDKDCRIYVTLFPCNECAKIIIQAGIKEVIYLSKKEKESDENKTILKMKMLVKAGVNCRKFEASREKIELKFSETK